MSDTLNDKQGRTQSAPTVNGFQASGVVGVLI